MAAPKKTPDPTDVHVGSRVKLRRTMEGMSQEKLGEALGVTFQQVQKYEKGTNRIGASRMQQIAEALKVEPSFFFEDLPSTASGATGLSEANTTSYVVDFLSSNEGIQLNRAFVRITNPAIRRKVIDMVRTLADETGNASTEKSD